MMMIRYAQERDLDAMFQLAEESGVGMTSLPANKEILLARIQRSQKTLQGQLPRGEQGYVFVLEDTECQQVVGVSAIEVAVGLDAPFYHYHVGKQVHACQALAVYRTLNTLFLSHDLSGSSELCTLFLTPRYRQGHNGKFLSKVRCLFMAAFQDCFQAQVIAEMRGYCDEHGQSPFWNALGAHFFAMDFATADYLSGTGQKAFIAELMPRLPIYVELLPLDAQAVIGQVHPQTQPASHVLMAEGLQPQHYIDIFDGGPTLGAALTQLRAVRESQLVEVECSVENSQSQQICILSNDCYDDYRAILVAHDLDTNHSVKINLVQAQHLHYQNGYKYRILALDPKE